MLFKAYQPSCKKFMMVLIIDFLMNENLNCTGLCEGEDMLILSMDGTNGDLMVLGSNQKVTLALWHIKVEFFILYSWPHLPWGPGTKDIIIRKVKSFPASAPIQPFGIACI